MTNKAWETIKKEILPSKADIILVTIFAIVVIVASILLTVKP
jgi:hypothetical protein